MPAEQTTILPSLSGSLSLRFKRVALEVVSGADAGKRAPLSRRELTVGTHASNDLVLSDSAVSRFHFRLVASERGYRIVDDTSTNGTLVSGLAVRDAYLAPGAQIRVGETVLALVLADGDTEIPLSADRQFGGVLGASTSMREAFAIARRAAASDATVLLCGETGTGKDLLARAIHREGSRASGPFIVFDCAAVPANLIESALFGHVRGSFTGADRDHPGVFRAADGGTLFLDELGELPRDLQPKLLRALENSEVTPVGATSPVKVNVRVVAATHRDLRAMVSKDTFRPDLYYRLAVISIDVPPLRERREDIEELACHFLFGLVDEVDRRAALESKLRAALAAAADYAWPGNVRELRNAVERAVALDEANADAMTLTTHHPSTGASNLRGRLPLGLAREQFDREYLRDLMQSSDGDLQRAADFAEIHPKSLARLLRRYKVGR